MTTEALTAIKAALAAPSAWRWSFDRSWHYATAKPGKFTWADPEVTQPLYAIETSAISSLISSYEAMERRVEELEEALKSVRSSVRNARGAVESFQVVDKDVHGTLSRVISSIDSAITPTVEKVETPAQGTPAPETQLVGQDYWHMDIVRRLAERAAAARDEDTGTAIADATHFDQAAAEIIRLREIVERAQSIISISTYPNWHATARAALAEIPIPTPEPSVARALCSGPSSRAHSEVETDDRHEQGNRDLSQESVEGREIGGRGSFLASSVQRGERDVCREDSSNDRQVTDGGGVEPPPPQPNVGGRWRVIEAATAPGYWGIELEDAGNDDDAILCPQKIHRDTVARIVEAHNATLATTEGQP